MPVPTTRRFRTPHALLLVPLLLCALAPAAVRAQVDPLDRRAHQLADAVCGGMEDPASFFDAAFLKQVPPATVAAILAQFCAQAGPVTEVVTLERTGPWNARLEFHTAKGMRYPVTLGIAAGAPHLVGTLWFGPPQADLGDWDEVQAALDALPGTVGFAARELASPGRQARILADREPDRALAVGSTFKLYVLGRLSAEVAGGGRAWSDTTVLRAAWRSLPSGVMQDWPVGAPVTLHTLALQMIAVSDNTAADHLVRLLGRETVEAGLADMGMADPAANRPFLTTREMFLLKSRRGGGDLLDRWRAGGEAGRRALLGELDGLDLAVADVVLDHPVGIADAEWFASPADLGRVLDHLRHAADDDPARAPLSLLAVNPGLSGLADAWDYVGFKGGSEPGALGFAWLLRDARGRWFTLTFAWNDAEATLDQGALLAVVPAAARLLAGS